MSVFYDRQTDRQTETKTDWAEFYECIQQVSNDNAVTAMAITRKPH